MSLLIKTARPGFWSTSVWFYLLPLGGQQVFGDWRFWLGLVYVTLPFGLLIYGCNDLVDGDTDRLNPRKDTFLFGAWLDRHCAVAVFRRVLRPLRGEGSGVDRGQQATLAAR